MSHELEFNANGEAMMAYVGETPWHGLGKKVLPDLTADQMLEAAQLNWEVSKEPLYISNGDKYEKTAMTALVRSTDRKILTYVSEGWEPVQNRTAFEFFNEYVMAGDMEMHTAGSLKNGEIVWALAKVKESFALKTPQGEDLVESHLLFTNPHKFGKCIDIRFTPTRVVCWNTLSYALNEISQRVVRASHRSVFDADKVKQTLKIAHNRLKEYENIATFLASKNYTKESLVEYFREVFPKQGATKNEANPTSKNCDLALDLIDKQPGAKFAAGTWWQSWNTVTYMADHVLGRTTDTRLESAWYGTNQNRKENAMRLAIEYAEAS